MIIGTFRLFSVLSFSDLLEKVAVPHLLDYSKANIYDLSQHPHPHPPPPCPFTNNHIIASNDSRVFVLLSFWSWRCFLSSFLVYIPWPLRTALQEQRYTRSCQYTQHFCASIQSVVYGCQRFRLLTCAHMLMHAIAHGSCTGESLHWKLTLEGKSLSAPEARTPVGIAPGFQFSILTDLYSLLRSWSIDLLMYPSVSTYTKPLS